MKNINYANYLVAIAIVTIFSGFIYAAVQQSYRNAANDPQLQIARDMNEQLKSGKSIDRFMMNDTIEISKSLSIFKVLYDDSRQPFQATGFLDGALPKMPKGTFDFAKANGENVFTWQPRAGVRMAMVLKCVQSPGVAFVAVGRSLEEIEKRENSLAKMSFMAWILSLAVLLFHWLAVLFFKRMKNYS